MHQLLKDLKFSLAETRAMWPPGQPLKMLIGPGLHQKLLALFADDNDGPQNVTASGAVCDAGDGHLIRLFDCAVEVRRVISGDLVYWVDAAQGMPDSELGLLIELRP